MPMLRGSENPSSTRPDAGQVNRWGSADAADGAAEAIGAGGAAAAGAPCGAAGAEGADCDGVADGEEDAEEAAADGAPPATDGRPVVLAGASARCAVPLASERTSDGTVSPAGSAVPAGRTGSSGVTLTGEACAAGVREVDPDDPWPEEGEAAPDELARLAGAPEAEGAGRGGVVAAGRGALAVAVPDAGGGVDERFSTGAGRGAAQPASSATSANATSGAGSGLARARPAVRAFKSVV